MSERVKLLNLKRGFSALAGPTALSIAHGLLRARWRIRCLRFSVHTMWMLPSTFCGSHRVKGEWVDMVSPIECTVSDLNRRYPETLTSDPYASSWLMEVDSPDAKTNFRSLLRRRELCASGVACVARASQTALAASAHVGALPTLQLLGAAGYRGRRGGAGNRSDAQTVILEGSPRPVIAKAASELDCQMTIMGTHGRSGLAHLLLGSVAEYVVRSSKVPVLTVRMQGVQNESSLSGTSEGGKLLGLV